MGMGGFVVASIIGFWMRRLYVKHWAVLRKRRAMTRTQTVVFISLGGGIVVASIAWALFFDRGRVATEKLMDTINGGSSTRVLLGLLLGAVIAYAIDRRVVAPSADRLVGTPRAATAAASDENRESEKTPDKDPAGTVDKTLIASVAAIVLLALSAPHLDDWFTRLSGLKTSVIEFQLTTISTSEQAIKPDRREAFADQTVLQLLREYDKQIDLDISYMGFQLRDFENQEKDLRDKGADRFPFELREIGDAKKKLEQQKKQLTDLYTLFHNVVSPATDCFWDAIDNGLNVESVRRRLGDVTDMVTRLVLLEGRERALQENERKAADGDEREKAAGQSSAASRDLLDHRRAIRAIAEAPKATLDFLPDDQRAKCEAIKLDEAASIPPYWDYKDLPHLHVARAALLWFVNDDNLAIRVLQDAVKLETERKAFKEFQAPRLLATLMYYQGDGVEQFAPILEGMKTTAQERQELIARVESRCISPCDRSKDLKDKDELRNRARHAEFTAMNNLAYAIAEDLAQELRAAEALTPTALDYAEIISEAMKSEKDKFTAEERDGMLDTTAFVTIVTEARRSRSYAIDKNKIRNTVAVLEKLVNHEEERVRVRNLRLKLELQSLHTLREHLNSARALLER
jgi:hypothetical protein